MVMQLGLQLSLTGLLGRGSGGSGPDSESASGAPVLPVLVASGAVEPSIAATGAIAFPSAVMAGAAALSVSASGAVTLPAGIFAGSVPASSDAPVITSAGTISGTGVAGSVLTISGATWDGAGTPSYQWTGSSSGPVIGATDTSFVVPPSLAGEDVDCVVTVSNTDGADSAVAAGPICTLVETPIQFNPADKSATVTLSNGNISASMSTNALACVRSTLSFDDTVGNFYFELSWPATAIVSTAYIGVSDPTSTLAANSNADDKDYITFVAFDGRYNSRAGSAFSGGITPSLTGGDTVRVAVITTGVTRRMCVGTSAGWVLGDPDVDPENGLVLPKTGPLKIHCCPRSSNATVFTLRTATADLNHACPASCVPAARVLGFRQHVSAAEADEIVARLGINGHFANGGTGWQDDTDWHTPLRELGVRRLRTNTSGASVTWGLMLAFPELDYLVLGAPKVGTPVPTFPTTNMNNGWNATITNVGADRLIGVEGGNEVNDGAATGWEGRTNTASGQVKALRDADAPGIPMLTPSVHRRSTGAMQALEDDAAQATYATIANIHVYSGEAAEVTYTDNATNPIAPYTIVSNVEIGYTIDDALRIWGLDEFWVTEFGTQQQGIGAAASGYIGNDTAAKYLLRQICGMYALGAGMYFIYSLFDDVGVNKYGLLSTSDGENYVKRPTYYAVQRFIDILGDPGAAHTPADTDIFLTGDVSNITSMVFQKRDGTRYLVLYQQALSWDAATHTPISVPPIDIEVSISTKAANVTKWEPSLSAASVSVGTDLYTWTASVKDEVSIYEISATAPSGVPAELSSYSFTGGTVPTPITPAAGDTLIWGRMRTFATDETTTAPYTDLSPPFGGTFSMSMCYVVADGTTEYSCPYAENATRTYFRIVVSANDSTFSPSDFVAYYTDSASQARFGASAADADFTLAVAGLREPQTSWANLKPSEATLDYAYDSPANLRDGALSSYAGQTSDTLITPSTASQTIAAVLTWKGAGGGGGSETVTSFYNAATDTALYLDVDRTAGELAAGEVTGGGMQYTRSVTTSPANPSVIIRDFDVNGLRKSINFGAARTEWHAPGMIGLTGGHHGHAVAMDPEDANRVLCAQSVGSRTAFGNMADYNGLYLSTDGATTFTPTQTVALVGTTNASPNRHSHQTLAYAPGGTPATRTWYFIVTRDDASHTTNNCELWRSTNGGTSWTRLWVITLSSANFGNKVSAAAVTLNGTLWLGTDRGLWYASNPTSFANFTRHSSVPADDVLSIRTFEDSNEIWLTCRNNGVYHGFGTSISQWTACPSTDPYFLDVCRANRSRVLVFDPYTAFYYTHDAGATWGTTTMHSRIGLGSSYQTSVSQDNMMIRWHESDQNVVWLSGAQMSMLSTNGGLDAYPDAAYDSTIDAYCLDQHPTDPLVYAMACQDVKGLYTQDGFMSNKRGLITDNVYNNEGYPKRGEGVLNHPGIWGNAFGYFGTYGGGKVHPCWHMTNDSSIPGRYSYLHAGLPDISNYAKSRHHTSNPLIGYMGRQRITFTDTATYPSVTAGTASPWNLITDSIATLPYLFLDMVTEQPDVIWMAQSSSVIARSSNRGASVDATVSATQADWYAVDGNKPSICAPNDDKTTLYLCGRSGLKRVTGIGGTQSVSTILDIRDYQGPSKIAGAPSWSPTWIGEYAVTSFSIDPFDENHGIATFINDGGITLLETFDLLDSAPTWTAPTTAANGHSVIPRVSRHGEFLHLTGDYVTGGLQGYHIIRRQAAHDSIPGIPASIFDLQKAFLVAATT